MSRPTMATTTMKVTTDKSSISWINVLHLWMVMMLSIPTVTQGNFNFREPNDHNSRYNDNISSSTTTAAATTKTTKTPSLLSHVKDNRFMGGVKRVGRGGGPDEDMTTNSKYDDGPSSNIASSSSPSTSSPSSSSSYSSFEIIDETIVYSGWRTITQRKVRMRNGHVVDFDLVGVKTGGSAVLIFAWDAKTKTCTLIREYMPGSNNIHWGLAAGLVEDKHNHNIKEAARQELEEECHLTGGTWIALCRNPSAMDKYTTTTISCFLVLDPEHETNPRPLDAEEDIEIVNNVTIPQILNWIQDGEMNLVGAWGCLLAIEKLRELELYS